MGASAFPSPPMIPLPEYRPNPLVLFARFAVFCAFLQLPLTTSAQTKAAPAALREAPLSAASIQKQIDQTKTDASLDEVAKTEVTSILEAALASLTSAADFERQTAEFKKISDQGPAEISAIRAELASRQSGKLPSGGKDSAELAADASAEMINARLTSEKARLTELTRQVREWETQITALEGRPSTNRERIAVVTRLLSEAQTKFSKWSGLSAGSPKERAELAADQSRIRTLRSELTMLEQESLTFDLQRELTEARRNLTASDLTLTRDRVTRLDSRSGALVTARIGEAERLVSELGLEAIADVPLLSELVKETRELTTKNQILLGKIAIADTQLKDAEINLEQLKRDAESISAQIEIGGLEGEFSESILEVREALPKAKTYRNAASDRRTAISEARLDAFRLDHELDTLPLSNAQYEAILKSISSRNLTEDALKKIEPALKNLIETRIKLRKDAIEGNRKLAQTLGDIDLIENSILAAATEFRDYLGEKLIWVASSPPLGANAFTGMRTAFIFLLGPDALAQYGYAVARIDISKWILAVLLAIILLLPRRRLHHYLKTTEERTHRISQDSIGNTLGALGATLWLALPVPALLWFFGWIFTIDVDGTATTYALGKGLSGPALLLLVFRFSAILCWNGGVAEAHFRWPRPILDSCHRALMAAIFLYLPAHMLLAIWFNGSNLTSFQGPGRLVFIAAMILITVILERLFRLSHQHISPAFAKRNWMMKLRKVWTMALILLPLALAVLAALGHFLTAVVLAYQVQNTALVVLSGALVYGLLTKWVSVRERRIALQNAIATREEKRKALRDGAGAPDGPAEKRSTKEESIIPVEEEEILDWGTIGEQTRHLIRAIVTVTVIFGCWLVWAEVLPALKYLDARNIVGQISISDIIWLTIITIITHVIVQNLPGLLEVTFLQALELEPGVRNAITTICQYAIIAIAVAIAFETIGLDMSNFGWIAAALSVGLGFGLQEVVANFVSGLILLFERPIRVGDTVTVAGVDGVVTKVRIRATTITNWDKKEFIVPNKEFITGTIMNWTLSNAMTRLVIPVGIAYGSDIQKAQEILLGIARSQSEVLSDPEPVAVFELFGDSALNLSLRCYLPRPELRLEMTNRINTLIHDRFTKAGIEIPFPQRDLHIRSVHPSVNLGKNPPSGA